MNAAGTAQEVTFNSGVLTAYNINTSGYTLTIDANAGTGIINNNNLAETFSGTGAVTVGATETWNAASGGLTFSATTLNINNALTLSGASAISVSSATNLGANLTYTGSGTGSSGDSFSGTVTLTGSRTITNNGTGSLTFGAVNLSNSATSRTLTVNGSGATSITGVIANGSTSTAGALTYSGTGTLTLSGLNTYAGATSINSGTLSINSIASVGGGSSALGAPASTANGTIAIGSTTTGGTLQYTGGTVSTNRVINLAGTTGGATLDASGTGAITFTNAFTATGSGAKTLTLTGSNTGFNTISGAIVDSGGGATSLAKTGAGEWVLGGTNTYTGVTNITGGTLQIAGAANTTWLGSNATVNISNGGTLDLGGVTANVVAFGTKQFNISGAGVGNNGAIVNNSAVMQSNNVFQNITLTGAATIGGGDGSTNTQNGRWDIRGGSGTLAIGNFTLTKTGSNQVTVAGGAINSTAGGSIVVNQGEFAIQTSTTANGPGTFTFNDGTTLGLWKNTTPGNVTMAMTFNGSNTVLNESSTVLAPSIIGSNMTINGTTNFDIADTTALTLTGQLTAGTGAKTIILNGANSTVYKTGTPYVYDGQLNLGANETFNGTLDLNAGTLDLNGFNLTVDTLHITGDSTIDFGAGMASILNATNFIIDSGVTLTIADWANAVDYFYAHTFTGASYNIRGGTPENQIGFNGFSSNSTVWQSYDNQITPVPESVIYGALLTATSLGFFLWHRRKSSVAHPAVCRVSSAPLTGAPCKDPLQAC